MSVGTKVSDLVIDLILIAIGAWVVLAILDKYFPNGTGKPSAPNQPTPYGGPPDDAPTAAAKTVGKTAGEAAGAGLVSAGGGAASGGLSAGQDAVINFFSTLFGWTPSQYMNNFGAGTAAIKGWFGGNVQSTPDYFPSDDSSSLNGDFISPVPVQLFDVNQLAYSQDQGS